MRDRQPVRLTRRELWAQARSGGTNAKEAAYLRRRRLLQYLGVGGIILVTGGVTSLAVDLAGVRTNLSPQKSTDFAKYLRDLDTRIARNPSLLSENADEIAERSIEVITKRMGYQPFDKRKIRFFDSSAEFVKTYIFLEGCLNPGIPEGGVGLTMHDQDMILINLANILRGDPRGGKINTQAGTLTAETVIHESYHYYTGVKEFSPEDKTPFLRPDAPYSQKLGLAVLFINSFLPSKPNRECTTTDRLQLEEAITQYETLQTLKEAGVAVGPPNGFISDGYPKLIERYARSVVKPYFPQDHRLLFQKQQSGNPSGYFELLGKRINPYSRNPSYDGEKYLTTVIPGPN